MLNQCNFIGRLGNDPEIKYLPDGKAVASLSVGCSEKWNDKNTGEKKEKTEWVRCACFGKLAEVVGKHLTKGSLIYVSGKMQTKKWQDQNGQDRYTTEIVLSEMKMLGSKKDNQPQQSQQNQGWGQPQQPQQAPQHVVQQPPADFDDDIPF